DSVLSSSFGPYDVTNLELRTHRNLLDLFESVFEPTKIYAIVIIGESVMNQVFDDISITLLSNNFIDFSFDQLVIGTIRCYTTHFHVCSFVAPGINSLTTSR